ncbi:MAG: hypothetical protein ACRDID_06820, partial [Ktedonobacterales bacterium]
MNDAQTLAGFRASRYTGSLVAIGALTASITTLVLILVSNGAAISSRQVSVFGAPAYSVPWIAALLAVALAAAGVSAALAALTIRAIRIAAYMRALHAYATQELARAGMPTPRATLQLGST